MKKRKPDNEKSVLKFVDRKIKGAWKCKVYHVCGGKDLLKMSKCGH
jgi:hypothetical protein